MSTWRLIEGECVEAMRAMDAESVDAVVCDPPYGIGFMGKEWDGFTPGKVREATARHLPIDHKKQSERSASMHAGQYDLTRSGNGRFQEWCWTWACEALRVLKPGGHLLAFGGTRTYHRLTCAIEDAGFEVRDCLAWIYGSGFPKSRNLDGDYKGWGTALKPAHEPIVLARKPLRGTVAQNVTEHGTGALNVKGCEIESEGHLRWSEPRAMGYHGGRWPANVIMDAEAGVLLDEQSVRVNEAGASRFFYCPKPDRAERNVGLEGFPAKPPTFGAVGISGTRQDWLRANTHPTVKPVALMQWLCRLVTPKGGTVLDPFAGSGTTGMAALREGFSFIGIEREAEYVQIARARILGDAPLLNAAGEATA